MAIYVWFYNFKYSFIYLSLNQSFAVLFGPKLTDKKKIKKKFIHV